MILRASFIATAAGLASLLSLPCYAGGDSWAFVVTSFTSDESDKYSVELIPVDRGTGFPTSCASLTITGEYASLFWFFKFGDGPGRKEHRAALALLGNSFKSGMPINFGWIGDGINVTREAGACVGNSRGLAVDKGSGAVYSYFKWP